MKNQKTFRLITIVSSILIWLISNLHFFLSKIGGTVFIWTSLSLLILFLTSSISLILLIRRIIWNKEWRNKGNYFAAGLPFVLIIISQIQCLNLDENTFQSKVKIRACYEGTMNSSRLFLREDNSFENINVGFMGYVHYTSGTWSQKTDTLILNFNGEKPNLLGKKMLIKDDKLYKITQDSLVPTHYYLGYCKGLN